MTKVNRSDFRRAQCKGFLAACEMIWATNGRRWVKDGRTVAIEIKSIFGLTNYYLEGIA
jgi:hypothetical protein